MPLFQICELMPTSSLAVLTIAPPEFPRRIGLQKIFKAAVTQSSLSTLGTDDAHGYRLARNGGPNLTSEPRASSPGARTSRPHSMRSPLNVCQRGKFQSFALRVQCGRDVRAPSYLDSNFLAADLQCFKQGRQPRTRHNESH